MSSQATRNGDVVEVSEAGVITITEPDGDVHTLTVKDAIKASHGRLNRGVQYGSFNEQHNNFSG